MSLGILFGHGELPPGWTGVPEKGIWNGASSTRLVFESIGAPTDSRATHYNGAACWIYGCLGSTEAEPMDEDDVQVVSLFDGGFLELMHKWI